MVYLEDVVLFERREGNVGVFCVLENNEIGSSWGNSEAMMEEPGLV